MSALTDAILPCRVRSCTQFARVHGMLISRLHASRLTARALNAALASDYPSAQPSLRLPETAGRSSQRRSRPQVTVGRPAPLGETKPSSTAGFGWFPSRARKRNSRAIHRRYRLGPPNTGGRIAMSQMSTGLGRQEKRAQPPPSVAPLAVPPLEAARLRSA